MPRFVILEHDHPCLHWDLMLEAGEKLRTWRLAEMPRPGCRMEATAIGDHRRMYLDYEGPVSGDRGRVTRWDLGTFDWLAENDQQTDLEFSGGKLSGTVHLYHQGGDTWCFVMDAH